jgi:hypothetical protein
MITGAETDPKVLIYSPGIKSLVFIPRNHLTVGSMTNICPDKNMQATVIIERNCRFGADRDSLLIVYCYLPLASEASCLVFAGNPWASFVYETIFSGLPPSPSTFDVVFFIFLNSCTQWPGVKMAVDKGQVIARANTSIGRQWRKVTSVTFPRAKHVTDVKNRLVCYGTRTADDDLFSQFELRCRWQWLYIFACLRCILIWHTVATCQLLNPYLWDM